MMKKHFFGLFILINMRYVYLDIDKHILIIRYYQFL